MSNVYLVNHKESNIISENIMEKRLTLQIQSMLSEQCCDVKRIKELAFRRAVEQYKNMIFDDRIFQTEKLLNIINQNSIQVEFNEKLLEKTIEKIVVQKDGYLEFYFKNGSKRNFDIKKEDL